MYNCFCGFKTFKIQEHLIKKHQLAGLELEEKKLYIKYGKKIIKNAVKRYQKEEVSLWCLSKEGLDLSKYFKLLGIKRTASEEHQTKRYKNLHKSVMLDKYGVENISQADHIKRKKEETVFKHFGVRHNFMLDDCKEKAMQGYQDKINSLGYKEEWLEKYKNTCLEKYGVINVAQDKDIKKKISNSNKKRMANLSIDERRQMTAKARASWNEQNSWTSSIEIRVQKLLKQEGMNFQPHITLYDYNYDILIGDNIIEINGDFWHANPKTYSEDDFLFEGLSVKEVWEKDRRKKEIAEKNGKNVIVLWECDIIALSDQQLIEVIKTCLI